MPIEAVLLDYGKVLGLPPRDEEFEALRLLSGMAANEFPSVFWRHRDQYDRGLLDGPGFWGLVARDARLSLPPEQIERLIAQDIKLWLQPNPIMVEWAHVLCGRGIKTAVLSNMPCDHSQYLSRNAKWLQVFNHLCFSGELKYAKPDEAIYRACLEGLHATPEQSLFIDDHEGHVLAARAVGLNALVFQSVEQLAKDLEPFGLAESFAEAARNS